MVFLLLCQSVMFLIRTWLFERLHETRERLKYTAQYCKEISEQIAKRNGAKHIYMCEFGSLPDTQFQEE